MALKTYTSVLKVANFGGLIATFGEVTGKITSQPSYFKSIIFIPQLWNLANFYPSLRRSRKYINHVTHLLSLTDICFFHQKLAIFVILGNKIKNLILIQ